MYISEYYVPSHITGFFVPFFSDDYLKTGSTGAGVSLSTGLRTVIKITKGDGIDIFLNTKKTTKNKALVSKNCIDILKDRFQEQFKNKRIVINHYSDVPVEAGFGASASAALGICFSIKAFLSITNQQCIAIAHETEVKNLSGLGDVVAEVKGGVEIRKTPGVSGIIENIVPDKNLNVLALSLGMKKTESVLKDPKKLKLIEKCGTKQLQKLISEPTVEKMMECSREFSHKTDIFSKELLDLADTISEINSYNASGIMIGDGIFTFINKEDKEKILDLLKDIKGEIVISPISKGLL